jgi:7-keto-8-aminopelargonate synthetase-like enzyme
MSGLAPPLQLVDRTSVRYLGRILTYFGGCDYFRLSSHPAVRRALRAGLEKFGLNVAASRLTTGNHPLYELAERRLAQFFGVEAVALVSSGYVTNLVVAQALAGTFTHVLIDEGAHTCLDDAAPFFKARVLAFRDRDPAHAARRLSQCGPKAKPILLTDGMFSLDGELAPVEAYLRLLPRDGALLLDDAHGAGTLGRTGQGTLEVLGVRDRRIIRTITLSKAFGAYGGAVLGTRALIRRIQTQSPLFAGNTPPPLPLVCAALKSLDLLRSDPALRRRLIRNTTHAKDRLRRAGWALPDTPSPILSFLPDGSGQVRRLKRGLLAAGIYPSFIKYPGGPPQGYFRFALSSEHTREQLDRLVDALLPARGSRPR